MIVIWAALISGVFVCLSVTITGILVIKGQRETATRLVQDTKRAEKAAGDASGVLGRKLDAIHILVNSATGVFLHDAVIDKKRIADFTGAPADIEAWKRAVEAAVQHDKNQAVLDALTKQQLVHEAEMKEPTK